jgi:hypothetical protein
MVRRPLHLAGYLSAEQAALRTGYTPRYLADLTRIGRLPGRRVAQKWFIDERALDAFVTNREARTTKVGRPRKGKPQETGAGRLMAQRRD